MLPVLRDIDAEFADAAHDIRTPATLAAVRGAADRILADEGDPGVLWDVEKESTALGSGLGRLTQLSVKLARSRAFLRALTKSIKVTVVIPAYGENVRLLPRGTAPGQHPDGEDFVVEKAAQLAWLFEGTEATYEVLVVDDMSVPDVSLPDPETSGAAIARVVSEHDARHWRIVYLDDGVSKEKDGEGLVAASLRGVEIPKNTRKAGAVYYGFAKAIEAGGDGDDHVIVLTDCDLSVDLGQLGNLVAPIVSGNAVAGTGSRRLPESVLEITPARNTRANAARYFRQLLLPDLLPLDTQCGAKAFAAPALATVVGEGMQVLDFSFDIELLTKLALRYAPDRLNPVPMAWFDSSELTTTDSSVHFGIMRAQLRIAQNEKTGSGPVWEAAATLAGRLTADEPVWLAFLEQLAGAPDLLQAIESFDSAALSDLERLVEQAPTT